jgi:two-component system sensor histidine kinase DesK
MRLLPKNQDFGWTPYLWLAYLVFFFLDPFLSHASLLAWVADGLGALVFLVCFFGLFWVGKPYSYVWLGVMLLLGIGFAPYNSGASTFFIYTASFLPFVIEEESTVLKSLLLLVAIAGIEGWLLHRSWWFFFYAGGLSLAIGGGNIYFAQRNRANAKLRQANQEIEQLAKIAERERIARDLHDVLGHTLSVIILKSELAGKLIDRDPERAKAEIADVEQTSRTALSEVRNTIRGYQARSLESELKQARLTLETAGVKLQCESVEVPLTPAQESVVALIVREAVTNVVRHAQADSCQLRLARMNGNCRVEIHDNGRGCAAQEGNGLRGMRERVEALGGSLLRENRSGTRLTIEFPLVDDGCPR